MFIQLNIFVKNLLFLYYKWEIDSPNTRLTAPTPFYPGVNSRAELVTLAPSRWLGDNQYLTLVRNL